MLKTVYGPVPSWRLGRSLGLDAICREKTCNFDCLYCQLGKTLNKTNQRQEFVSAERLENDLRDALKTARADVITFSGSGEPTLARNLGELIKTARGLSKLPLAILTNSALLTEKKVRKELSGLDIVVAKLDAANENVFRAVNRPLAEITFRETLKGIKKMRREFKGERFALQCMFMKENEKSAGEIAELAREIDPDEVQIDTPLRPAAVPPLSEKSIELIKKEFKGLNFTAVYDARKPRVKVLDLQETKKRRASIEEEVKP